MRTFLAVELPSSLHTPIRALQQELAHQLGPLARLLRWTRPDTVHLTLRFLGETDDRATEDLHRRLHEALVDHSPIVLTAGGIGCFPQVRKPRILWLGINRVPDTTHIAYTQLCAFQSHLETVVRAAGFPPETKPFRPHLTLARTHRNAQAAQLAQLGGVIAALAEDASPTRGIQSPLAAPFLLNEVVHFRSELGKGPHGGSHYTAIRRLPMGRPA